MSRGLIDFRVHGRKPSGLRPRAFTLIEVLVVVSIIALLIAVLIPSLASARELARRTTCATQLSQMTKAMIMYNGDHKDFLPGPLHQALELETVGKTASGDHESFHLPWYIRRYFTDRSKGKKLTDLVVKCPTSAKETGVKNEWAGSQAQRPFTYALNNWTEQITPSAPALVTDYWGTNPSLYFGWPGPGSGFHQFWGSGDYNTGRFVPNTNAADIARPKRINQIRQAAREWAIADAFCYTTENRPVLAGSGRRDGQWRIGTYQNAGWIDTYKIRLPRRPYHDKGINVAMFDNHVEYQRPWRGTVNPERP